MSRSACLEQRERSCPLDTCHRKCWQLLSLRLGVSLEHHRPALALKPAGAIFEVKQSTATSQPVAAQYEINPFKHFINHMRIEYLSVAM